MTAILPDLRLEQIVTFAAREGFACLEIMCWPVGKAERKFAGVTHIDVTGFTRAQADDVNALCTKLFPLATLVTPNLDEAEILIGAKLSSVTDLRAAARTLHQQFGCAALVKGGHLRGFKEAVDIQIKLAVGSRGDWTNGAPLHVQAQVQIEMACWPSTWGAVAAYLGPGPLYTEDLDFNENFFRSALPKLEAFHKCVQEGRLPDVEGPLDLEPVRRLFVPNGETRVLDARDLIVAEEWAWAKAQRTQCDDEAREHEASLRMALKGYSFGLLPDGSYLRLRTRKGAATPTLDRWWPRRRRP